MGKNEFYFPSCDGRTGIRAVEWSVPAPRAIVQLIHGIAEHIDRYEDFAAYLCSCGYTVVGHDILGHGKSVAEGDEIGLFAPDDGWFVNVDDADRLRRICVEKYPGVKHFMLGHSMGSFLLRTYLTKYADGLAGVVISGTGYNPQIVLSLGMFLANREIKKHGPGAKSESLRKLCFGTYNKRIENPKNENEWLSRDIAVSEKYCADPLCGFLPGAVTYREMMRGISYIQKSENIEKVPKNLPVFMISGEEDPVGDYGRGVLRVYNTYRDAGMCDITLKLYSGGRHEMLNETNRAEVFSDVRGWLDSKAE